MWYLIVSIPDLCTLTYFAPIVFVGFVLGPCFVLQYFVPFLVLLSSRGGRESWLLYFCCVLNVMVLLFSLNLPYDAMDWSVLCDCGISWSGTLFVLIK